MATAPVTPVLDLETLGQDFVRDPYPVYAALREKGPAHPVRTAAGDLVWLIVGHEACRAAYTDQRISRDWRKARGWSEIPYADASSPALDHMLMRDPPDHTRLRRLVARSFTPRRVEGLAPRVREITDGLLDAMSADGARSADLVEALAFPLPMTVICELLGVPDMDRDSFRRWSNVVVAHGRGPEEYEAWRDMTAYLQRLTADKREKPGDDLLSEMIHTVDEGGDRLSPDELIGMCFLLLVAGHETTVNLIGNGMRALFAHPDQLALLRREPALLENAVEEMLRWDGPVEASTQRLALEDVEFEDGTVIPAGSVVLITMADADRDPVRFAEADRFDIRRDARGHIAFGHGLHYCLGAPLARLEGRTAFRALLDRFPALAFDGEERELPRVPGLLMRGVKELPVRW